MSVNEPFVVNNVHRYRVATVARRNICNKKCNWNVKGAEHRNIKGFIFRYAVPFLTFHFIILQILRRATVAALHLVSIFKVLLKIPSMLLPSFAQLQFP
jgi:hypothetical protein